MLAQGYRRVIDIGRVEGGLFPQGRYFESGVGIDFDAVVGFEAQKMERLHGFLGYLIAAFKTIFLYYRAPLVRIDKNLRWSCCRARSKSSVNHQRAPCDTDQTGGGLNHQWFVASSLPGV